MSIILMGITFRTHNTRWAIDTLHLLMSQYICASWTKSLVGSESYKSAILLHYEYVRRILCSPPREWKTL